jgi:hydroxymethylpyrimidine/phosphomethylpyrimidine kinase
MRNWSARSSATSPTSSAPRPRDVQRPTRVLVIAGSDSGGGAGIQGDIKTITALGGYAATAITAITVQNTTGVSRSHAVPPDIVADQINAVLSDIGADAIKTGMLVSAAVVRAVADALRNYAEIPLVVDTVMTAKGATALLDEKGVDALRTFLFPMAALITPNIPEAERLTGRSITNPEDMVAAAEKLQRSGARAVLVKGGHLAGDTITDILVDESGVYRFSAARLANQSTHGTGCALASAIATGLARGMTLPSAVELAREFVRGAIASGLAFGRGIGPINHLHETGK